jgi:hypothetical protein
VYQVTGNIELEYELAERIVGSGRHNCRERVADFRMLAAD